MIREPPGKKTQPIPTVVHNLNAVSRFREELRLLSSDNKFDHANSLRGNDAV